MHSFYITISLTKWFQYQPIGVGSQRFKSHLGSIPKWLTGELSKADKEWLPYLYLPGAWN